MKRILVIGCSGGGKSYFSKKLHAITDIPLYHLDMLYWNEDKTTVGREVLIERLTPILESDEWIIDGNYAGTMEMRMQKCDTVVFLDFPTELCLRGVRERMGKKRTDMPWIETEPDDEFIEFIKGFRENTRPKILALLEKYKGLTVYTFKSREEASSFLEELANNKPRCKWCNTKNPLYVEYHDNEWCVPNFDEKYLYEMLILETFQAGLSWECVLNKRKAFRLAYDGFDIDKVVLYDEAKIDALTSNKGIIRNRLKIASSIKNSKIFKSISVEYGSFYNYLHSFTNSQILYETDKTTNALSDAISADLKKRGMSFVGSVIIYSYLQAVGIIRSHDKNCFLYKSQSHSL